MYQDLKTVAVTQGCEVPADGSRPPCAPGAHVRVTGWRNRIWDLPTEQTSAKKLFRVMNMNAWNESKE